MVLSIVTMRLVSSLEPWPVTTIGRVCGVGIGAAYKQMVLRTPNFSAKSATASVNASHRMSGSGPDNSRKDWPALSRSTWIPRRGSSILTG